MLLGRAVGMPCDPPAAEVAGAIYSPSRALYCPAARQAFEAATRVFRRCDCAECVPRPKAAAHLGVVADAAEARADLLSARAADAGYGPTGAAYGAVASCAAVGTAVA